MSIRSGFALHPQGTVGNIQRHFRCYNCWRGGGRRRRWHLVGEARRASHCLTVHRPAPTMTMKITNLQCQQCQHWEILTYRNWSPKSRFGTGSCSFLGQPQSAHLCNTEEAVERRDNKPTFPMHLRELMRISAQLETLGGKHFLNYCADFILRLMSFPLSLYRDWVFNASWIQRRH